MRSIRAFVIFVIAVVSSLSAMAQVTNNRIEDRIKLQLDDKPFVSFTTHSDVQWDCINKALTSKCLVYHNDQWFTMTPPSAGPFYINIHNQSCRKSYGVQLVILEGDPCKTDSYQLKRCVPFSDQTDFFVKLDSLKPDTEYLVNVDGFLGDLCAFQIEFNSTMRGIPVNPSNTGLLTPNLALKDSVVLLQWMINDSIAFTVKDFHVYRKNVREKTGTLVAIPVLYNAYGAMQKQYEVYDTLHEKGTYSYSIYGTTHDDRILLSYQSISYRGANARAAAKRERITKKEFVYFASKPELVTVHVMDAMSERRLLTTYRRADKGKNVLLLDFAEMLEEGFYKFKVIVSGKAISEEFNAEINPDVD